MNLPTAIKDWLGKKEIPLSQQHGELGERAAKKHLKHLGLKFLTANFESDRGEIDLIFRDEDCLVFVEVKARDGRDFGAGGESVTTRKQRRIVDVALDYLARHRLTDRPCRFDVVSIELGPAGPSIELYQNAFDVGGSIR